MPPLLHIAALASAAVSSWRALAAAAPAGGCPVASCLGEAAEAAGSGAETEGGQAAHGPFNITFKPGHFVCKSCDASACKGCALLCDLKQCTGEFFEQQCWCEEGSLRKQTHKVYCDQDCSGGICDNPRFRCRSRQDACQPWWWCGEPPPKWGPSGGGAGAFAGLQDSSQRQPLARHSSRNQLRRQAALLAGTGSRLASAGRLAGSRALARTGMDGLAFSTGRFDCFSAAMPPKVWDEEALMMLDRGYIILDRRTCQGAVYDKDCFCWDNFKYLSGQDPMTSELKCDGRCSLGPCDGKTCSRRPPPPLPPPTAAPGAAGSTESREGQLIMEPVDEPVLSG